MWKDIVVLETAGVLAGPSVGQFFAELGARVIKLENSRTQGDVTRSWKLATEDPNAPVSAYFASVNSGKEHRLVDLSDPAQRPLLNALLQEADVLISNHLPKDGEKLGLSPARVRAINPRIVHGHVRGYRDDPARPAFDVVLQAETGWMAMNGSSPEHLAKLPVALIDLQAGHQLKAAVLVALLERERSGQGAYVEISLEEAALAGLANQATNWLMAGHDPAPLGTLHPNIAPYGELFACADGGRIVLAVGNDKQFAALCRTLALPDMPNDARFSDNRSRVLNRQALAAALSIAIGSWTRDALLESLRSTGVPAGALRSVAEALALPAAQRMIQRAEVDGTATTMLRTTVFRRG